MDGRIVQISTWTASLPLPFNGPSGASKAAMEVFATVYRAELKRFGIEVVVAPAGNMRTGALRKRPRHPEISHLLTDVQMSGLDGYELAHRAIAMRPGLEVIITSGTERMGGDFVFLPKPISMTKLQSVFGITCSGVRAQA